MAKTHNANTAHSRFTCFTQKKGRWSSSKSRTVPPPNAATNPTAQTPTASIFLRAAASTPDSAKAMVADSSTSSLTVSPQN